MKKFVRADILNVVQTYMDAGMSYKEAWRKWFAEHGVELK